MTWRRHRWILMSSAILLLLGCALIPDVGRVVREAEEALPLTFIGGVPVRVEASVEFENRQTMAGDELESSAGAWTHVQEGRLTRSRGWQPPLDRIEDASGAGRYVCYYGWGDGSDPATPHWTVSWSSELTFDEPAEGGRAAPDPPGDLRRRGVGALSAAERVPPWAPGEPGRLPEPRSGPGARGRRLPLLPAG